MTRKAYGAKTGAAQKSKSSLPLYLLGGALVLIIVGVFVLLRGSAGPSKAIEVAGKPKLTVDNEQIDFGKVPLGKPVTIRLTSLDSPLHKGGGKHQLAIDEFHVDIRAAARESASATFPPDRPGIYTFYCDVCCGGRSSPSMQGTFVVEG